MGGNDYHVLERITAHVRGWNRRIDRATDRVMQWTFVSAPGGPAAGLTGPIEAKRVSSYGGP